MTPYELTCSRGTSLQPDDASAGRLAQPGHLVEERRLAHQLIGKHHGERFVTDSIGRTSHRVAETQRRILVGEADPDVLPIDSNRSAIASRPVDRNFASTSSDGSKYASMAGLLRLVTITM